MVNFQEKTILIVDDKPANIKVLFDILNQSSFRVSVAKSGESALSKVQETLPDLILLDVMMPGIDGFETCRCLKANPKTQEIPIIFLSALDEVTDKIKAFTFGGVDYIIKPFQTEEVLARVKNQLALQAAKAEIEELNVELKKQAKEALLRAKVAEAAKLELEKEIKERQQVEAALRSSIATNRALLSAIPDSIFRINSNGIFVNFQAAKDEHLPLLTNDFLGKNLHEVLPLEVAQILMNCVKRALFTDEIQICEYQLLLNKQLHDYEARIIVTVQDEVIVIIRDITNRKQVERDIQKTLMKEKELSELKSRFVTMASHEFRTPLTTILSSTELLQEYSSKWIEEKKIKHFHRIIFAVNYMTRLLNDVLLIGKAEAGKLEFNPNLINIAQLCSEMVEEIQLTTNIHTIAFSTQGKCANAYIDEKLLRHILGNLLSNAIKYSPQGDTVNFELFCEQEKAVFRVRDRGIGIPLADQAKLFDSFHRASNVGTISGTGLGLAIVKKSVDLHGGKITVNSEVGVGTTFTVAIPVNKWS